MPKKNPQNLPKPQSATKPAPNKSGDLLGPPADVIAIRKEIDAFFKTTADDGNKIGSHKWGIYAFFDYDGEPIYVGQTYEGLGSRIGRHLNNQRTDAVAMNVLDPFEVAEIRVWPLDVSAIPKEQRRDYLDRAEFTVFQKVIGESKLGAILNEKPPRPSQVIELPKSYARRIIPADIFPHRKHPDIRIARRAATIASLARRISERSVKRGLRTTLLTQAKRLEGLAEARLNDFPEGAEDEDQEQD
ncbi:MAG: excinuclease ABC subunit C [Verrucomicrobia bacterium]|nr:MAG: excinuclease ABC subunit C [Verrucomicrobiota bacterium]PYJ96106.1 MAG: excinuclease ABC subunit C [Verrucomicrobiota bacterium]